MDVSRCVRREVSRCADALDRAAMESHPFQQGLSSPAVGDVSGSSQSVAGFFRGRPERSRAWRLLCAQTALFPRRGQCRTDQRGRYRGGTAGAVRRRGFYSPGLRAAAEFFPAIPGARQLADRSHAVWAIDPRGRESDYRQYVAVLAARNPLTPALATSRRKIDVSGIEVNGLRQDKTRRG